MNITLFKNTVKKNILLWGIFTTIMMFYSSVIMAMFSPMAGEIGGISFKDIMQLLPPELSALFNFDNILMDNVTDYMSSLFYGLLVYIFPMIYCIIIGNKLVAKQVDNGSMAFLLSTPISRKSIITTYGVFIIFSIACMFMILFLTGIITASSIGQPLRIWDFFKVNFSAFLLVCSISMISFFFSCLFNDTKRSQSLGAGIPVGFLVIKMLSDSSSKLEIFKYFTLYSSYDAVKIATGGNTIVLNLCLSGLIIILFMTGLIIFNKKRLPI